MRIGHLCVAIALGTLLLQIAPYVVFGFSSTLPAPLNSVPDLVDIALYAPFMAVAFYLVYSKVVAGTPVGWAYALSYALFFEGHGLHWAANSLDVYLGGRIPYYLDEVLSHKMMFSGLFLMLTLAGLSDVARDYSEGAALPTSGGILMGFSLALMFIEGQAAPELLLANVSYIAVYIALMHALGDRVRGKPFLTFSIATSVAAAIFMLLYLMVFGSFVQPSEWFG